MKIFWFVTTMTLVTIAAFGNDDQEQKRARLIQAIKSSLCNTNENRDLSKGVKADEEILLEASKKRCLTAVIGPMMPNESTDQDERRSFFKAVDAAEEKYLDYVRTDVIPRGKGDFSSGGQPWTLDEKNGIGANLAIFENLSKAACGATKLPELRSSDLCKRLSSVHDTLDELIKIDKEASSPDGEHKACVASHNPAVCFKDTKRLMAGTSHVSDWTDPNAYDWRLNQLVDGFAVFVLQDGSGEYLVGVKQDSLKVALRPGVSLLESAKCLKFTGDTETKNDRGFPVTLKTYSAVPCAK